MIPKPVLWASISVQQILNLMKISIILIIKTPDQSIKKLTPYNNFGRKIIKTNPRHMKKEWRNKEEEEKNNLKMKFLFIPEWIRILR